MKNNVIFDKSMSMALKGFLVVIMFWSHMFNHPERLDPGIVWTSVGSIFGKSLEVWFCVFAHVAVPLFFFVGGYGFYLTHQNQLSGSKVMKQLKKVYSKYWIVFAILVPVCFIMGKLDFSPVDFFLNLIGLNSTYCGEWWFLSTYIEIVVCMYFVAKLCKIIIKVDLKDIKSIYIMIISLILCGGGMHSKLLEAS